MSIIRSSASPGNYLVSDTDPIVTIPASITTNQDISDAAPFYTGDFMQGPDLAYDPELFEYQTRTITPRVEDMLLFTDLL